MFNWKLVKELKVIMENNNLEVALDFDEKLWDLHYATAPFLKENYGVTLKKEEITHWEFLVENFPKITEAWADWEVYKQGRPLPGSIQFVDVLKYIFGENRVKIVTSTFPGIEDRKSKLINEIYGISNVIHARNKSEHTKNCILMDDALHNIIAHTKENNVPGILYDNNYGWNQINIEDECSLTYRAKSYNENLIILHKLYT